ncbi:MAG: glucosamine--fructose-6-phosphate aminotransferase [Chloroflexi bacterium GWB2_49_20]|nr:MAG: glucosamine--fructose-6-phosphate aminotransferase [Chloroflexi bacterium GWB2_49_20]OGN79915.1 MAG: glucosamine--fructose-6-phosphate aminotransferase [Chloroflexi bacterium GWC2_49_37]OGN85550.1 MAG: glucosamine--fructose-6-phosphate aminotransferase [Chloroflexi bacterium GWD2_49_16]HBG74426.1 glucosamine--fructose-6-phosphate aminotransferase [Anaerolineae bacterium]HCC79607.1 glucosamine--fructose-6-phosphate aminotransferase [Anaerolineae bacterium]
MTQSILLTEINEQPLAMQRLINMEDTAIRKVAEAIRLRTPRYVMLVARGSSDNAARYGQYLFGAYNHLPVALATPSLFTLYKQPPNLKDALVLSISQSGQSPDILAVVESARQQGALTIAITNSPQSPLAKLSEHCIDLHAGPERSVAASKSYTNSLLALAILSTHLAQDSARKSEIACMPEVAASILSEKYNIISLAEANKHAQACVVIGRGYNYSTAFEIALKLKELSYLLAEPYSSADFKHGPVALVQDGFLVIAVIPEGKVTEELTSFMTQLNQRSPRLIVISPHPEALASANGPISLPSGIPEWLSPLVTVIPGQIFALGLALARGIDPDHPRGLDKVTLTR